MMPLEKQTGYTEILILVCYTVVMVMYIGIIDDLTEDRMFSGYMTNLNSVIIH